MTANIIQFPFQWEKWEEKLLLQQTRILSLEKYNWNLNLPQGIKKLQENIKGWVLQILNLTEEINNLSHEQKSTYNLAVNMFKRNPRAVLEMLKTERQEERWESWEKQANIIQFSPERGEEQNYSKAA
jgi:hypothetical protein